MSDNTVPIPVKKNRSFLRSVGSRIVGWLVASRQKPASSWNRIRKLIFANVSKTISNVCKAVIEAIIPLITAIGALASGSSSDAWSITCSALMVGVGVFGLVTSFFKIREKKRALIFQPPVDSNMRKILQRIAYFFRKDDDAAPTSAPAAVNCHASHKHYTDLMNKELGLFCSYKIREHVIRFRWFVVYVLGGGFSLSVGLFDMNRAYYAMAVIVALLDIAICLLVMPLLEKVFNTTELNRYLGLLELTEKYMKPALLSDGTTEFAFVDRYLSRLP